MAPFCLGAAFGSALNLIFIAFLIHSSRSDFSDIVVPCAMSAAMTFPALLT